MKYTIIFLSLFFGAHLLQGQERIQKIKTTFIANQLDLTASEAEKFWPIYNAYQKQLKALRDDQDDGFFEKYLLIAKLSDSEAELLIEQFFAFEQEIYKQEKKLSEDLKPIISAEKRVKLIVAEREFRMSMLRRFKQLKDR